MPTSPVLTSELLATFPTGVTTPTERPPTEEPVGELPTFTIPELPSDVTQPPAPDQPGRLIVAAGSPVQFGGVANDVVTCAIADSYRAAVRDAAFPGATLSLEVIVDEYGGPGAYTAAVVVSVTGSDGTPYVGSSEEVHVLITSELHGAMGLNLGPPDSPPFSMSIQWDCP